MKTTILILASALFSSQLLAADIYEFRRDQWETKPAPAKPAARTVRTEASRQQAAPPAVVAQPVDATDTQQQDAVVQIPDCAAGALCNDL